MRKIYKAIMILCLLYFVFGWIAVKLNLIELFVYFQYAAIAGAIASVLGLSSLIRPSLTRNDLQNLEFETITSLAETSKKLKELENKKSQAVGEINELEIQKEEMQFLVKKASLQLFLQEQYGIYEKRISEAIENNEDLSRNLKEMASIKEKLLVVEKEIEENPNVVLLRQIIHDAKRPKTIEEQIRKARDPLELIVLILIKMIKDLRLSMIRIKQRRLKA